MAISTLCCSRESSSDSPSRFHIVFPALTIGLASYLAVLGGTRLALGACSFLLRVRGKLYRSRAFLRFTLPMGPSDLIALLAGW